LADSPDNDDDLGVEQATAIGCQGVALTEWAGSTEESNVNGGNDGSVVPAVSQDPWPQQMAQTIAALCARAEPAFVNWTVTLPMDPQVLPQTDLRLSLSQHWLSLRFITQSPQAHHLVCSHRHRLIEQLERLPQLPHGIDIEVT
jgi:flagellar hook-length control protein FliK